MNLGSENCLKEIDRNNISSYYHFDDKNKEIRFLRSDMPTPWMNYLSNGIFHTMISQAGGGLAFYKSPQIWRITRYRFFNLPTDRSGPYIYIRDNDTGEYWSPTNEPTQLKPDKWESVHGLGYTRFSSQKDEMIAEVTYFVGDLENSLIWNLNISNNSKKARNISVFAYVEFSMMEFMRELQWQCYNKHQVSVEYLDSVDALIYDYGVEMQPKPDETPLVYFTADRKPDAYDGDRDEFIGSYRSEANPHSVENGSCTDSTLFGGDPCGALQFNLTLNPGKDEIINIFLGTGMTKDEIADSINNSRRGDFVSQSFRRLENTWGSYLNKFNASLPDKYCERMINIWNPYQVQRNFLFSRNISYYATGTFRGLGFRDTSQDILAQIPFDLDASKEKIRFLLGQQYRDGHVNHYCFPTEGWDPVTTIHSDDHLWPILAVWNVVVEEGNTAFLDEKIQYYDNGEATIYQHLLDAISFTENNLGSNGLPLMLRSDWNDQMFRVCRKGKGESIWTAMQLGVILPKLMELSKILSKPSDLNRLLELFERQKEIVNRIAWDGKWFRRAIMDDGRFLGSDFHDEAKIWLNAQSWAVMSRMADDERGMKSMDSVKSMLDTELGVKLLHPPIINFPDPLDPLTNYKPGTGENGSVFCHANAWAIIAECMLGRGDIAYKYYKQLIPAVAQKKAGAWRYKAEPYVYSSNLFGPESDKFGLANVSWLTGTASWMYIAVTQYILGVRASWEGLEIDPCIPSEWKDLKLERDFRGCRYYITISNKNRNNKGVKSITVDGMEQKENIILHIKGRKQTTIDVVI